MECLDELEEGTGLMRKEEELTKVMISMGETGSQTAEERRMDLEL